MFRLRGNHGCLQPGEELELPYTSQRSEAATEQPYFSHVMCLRPAKDAAASPAGSAGGSGAGQLSDAARALSSYSLAEVCTALEDGIFDPAELDRSNADDLLGDAIAAGDDELLFMLVDGGIGVSCSQPSLQLLLQYAQYEDLPQLALAALQQSEAEMTQAVRSLAYTAQCPACPTAVTYSEVLGYMRFMLQCLLLGDPFADKLPMLHNLHCHTLCIVCVSVAAGIELVCEWGQVQECPGG